MYIYIGSSSRISRVMVMYIIPENEPFPILSNKSIRPVNIIVTNPSLSRNPVSKSELHPHKATNRQLWFPKNCAAIISSVDIIIVQLAGQLFVTWSGPTYSCKKECRHNHSRTSCSKDLLNLPEKFNLTVGEG